MPEYADPKSFSTTFNVGKVTCRMRFDGTALHCEWDTRMPKRFNKKQLQQYDAGRHVLMLQIAKLVGGTVLVMDGVQS